MLTLIISFLFQKCDNGKEYFFKSRTFRNQNVQLLTHLLLLKNIILMLFIKSTSRLVQRVILFVLLIEIEIVLEFMSCDCILVSLN